MLSNTSTVRVFASGNTRIAEPEHTYRPMILRTLRATKIAIDTKKYDESPDSDVLARPSVMPEAGEA